MTASYPSFTSGNLRYHLEDLNYDSRKPPPLFRPRRARPGRLDIKAVSDIDLDSDNPPKSLIKSRRRLTTKLAFARENAKKFLRSVINPPNGQDSSQVNSKRNSWSPVKWAQPGDSQEPESPPENMRGAFRSSISGPANAHLHRASVSSVASNGSTATGRSDTGSAARLPQLNTRLPSDTVIPTMDSQDQKPVASGNGVTVGIHLAEPVLFVQGFEHTDSQSSTTAMLRGSLHLRVQKNAKIKAVTLKFRGKANTKWPEGIPPKKTEFEETSTLMSHTWPFFNAQFENAEKGTNADHVQLLNPLESNSSSTKLDALARSAANASNANLTSKEAKRLSLQVNQSRSFGKTDTPTVSTVASKGYRTFLPGDYIYNFELPIDSRLPETIDVELGSVKYELEASVERSGAFRANLSGTKEVAIIRAPAEGSLEQVEPIAISRNWEDQLHYDIVISGKSFPLGTQIPIAFKLTPLAKVQCHRIKVLISENIEYFCSNKRVHRMEPQRKVQLFEKRADSAPVSAFPGSTMRVTAGGGIPYDQRVAAANGEHVVPQDTTNLLGPLTNAEDSPIGPTEMEFNVQLPSCHNLRERDRSQRLHFDTTYQNIQVHHWIKIVMRLSRQDENDPKKRRHFEISIDSPFHILSCRATQANISLPAYSSPQAVPGAASLYECGCPDASRRRNSPTSFAPTLNALNSARSGDDRPTPTSTNSGGLTRPQQAHVHGASHAPDRPIHLLRTPSFNPPPFEFDAPPPPLITPPPQYNDIASPTSGLSDYFSRLSDAYDDSDDDEDGAHRSGRVNVPLTPGGRINRSMDLGRPWMAVGHGEGA